MTILELTRKLKAKKEEKILLRRGLEPHILDKFDKLQKLEKEIKEISDLVTQLSKKK